MLGGEGVHEDVDTVEQEADPLLLLVITPLFPPRGGPTTGAPVWSSPKATSSGSMPSLPLGRQAMLLTDEFGVEDDIGTLKRNCFYELLNDALNKRLEDGTLTI